MRWWLARAPADDDDELETLPDFEPARADRDTALAELHQEIAQELAEAAERIALRRELDRRRKEAREAAAAPFGDPELLDAARQAEAQGRHGQGQQEGEGSSTLPSSGSSELPGREAVLHTGAQGSGKSQAVAKALAGLKGGNVLMLVPTLKKAEEAEAEIERQIKLRRRCRSSPSPCSPRCGAGGWHRRPKGERHPAQGFLGKHGINFNRPPAERMCARPKALIDEAQKAAVPDPRHLLRHVLDAARLPLPRPARHHQTPRRPAHPGRRP